MKGKNDCLRVLQVLHLQLRGLKHVCDAIFIKLITYLQYLLISS